MVYHEREDNKEILFFIFGERKLIEEGGVEYGIFVSL